MELSPNCVALGGGGIEENGMVLTDWWMVDWLVIVLIDWDGIDRLFADGID